jgi:hypothetical protein
MKKKNECREAAAMLLALQSYVHKRLDAMDLGDSVRSLLPQWQHFLMSEPAARNARLKGSTRLRAMNGRKLWRGKGAMTR